ncbi:HNH endonuclease [Burkholderia vietnamiensis]|uniref:HNH endonuclease n=1 Tax=Burkholderia vietnamiensis TaxID=60552 RepID=UPI001B95A39F|nr:HNH endonuclease [Burkholderia vietnamiensis]MBR8279095.1 HNH endonuclease [Burkholderia vietnamiensis]
MSTELSLPPLKEPMSKAPVRELLIEAGHDVSEWNFTLDHKPIVNPNDNISRNTSWSFVGKGDEPTVVCLWYEDIDKDAQPPVYEGNDREYRQRLLDLDSGERDSAVRARLKAWTARSYALDRAVQYAYYKRRPVRLIMIGGIRTAEKDRGATADTVNARALDPATWFVTAYDDRTGSYRIERGVARPSEVDDGIDTITDPGNDPLLQEFIATLDETEREAVIKARVGQGPFRDMLLERWKGCSVTGCKLPELLVASHVKPWSRCETARERVQVANGLLLVPNLDRLFDRGLVTFDDNFRIQISSLVKAGTLSQLNVTPHMRLTTSEHIDMRPFLQWHRDNIFRP